MRSTDDEIDRGGSTYSGWRMCCGWRHGLQVAECQPKPVAVSLSSPRLELLILRDLVFLVGEITDQHQREAMRSGEDRRLPYLPRSCAPWCRGRLPRAASQGTRTRVGGRPAVSAGKTLPFTILPRPPREEPVIMSKSTGRDSLRGRRIGIEKSCSARPAPPPFD
jgi:hypothetical protein